jgi:hypothetical protein
MLWLTFKWFSLLILFFKIAKYNYLKAKRGLLFYELTHKFTVVTLFLMEFCHFIILYNISKTNFA